MNKLSPGPSAKTRVPKSDFTIAKIFTIAPETRAPKARAQFFIIGLIIVGLLMDVLLPLLPFISNP